MLATKVVAALRGYRIGQLKRGLAGSAERVFPVEESTVRVLLKTTLKRARVNPERLSFHSFRHTYASLMISSRAVDSVFISRQMGHSTPAITWGIYAPEFDRAAHAEAARAALDLEVGKVLAMSPEQDEGERAGPDSNEDDDLQEDSAV